MDWRPIRIIEHLAFHRELCGERTQIEILVTRQGHFIALSHDLKIHRGRFLAIRRLQGMIVTGFTSCQAIGQDDQSKSF